jgi:hypothetical protein
MHKSIRSRLQLFGVAVVIAAPIIMPTVASADPLISLKILGSTNSSGPFINAVPVSPGQTIYYELVGQIATAGVSNTQSSFTIAASQNSTDGIGGLNGINLADPASELTALGALQNGFDQGTGHSAGTVTGGSINGVIGLLGTGVTYVGASSPVVVYSGSFTAGTYANDTISGSGPSTFNARINTTSGDKNLVNKANGATDPYVGIAPLTLTESVPEPASISLLAAVGGALLRRRRSTR